MGPGGYYVKNNDYLLRNANGNCIVNCPTYGLKNLIDGKEAYYSKDHGYTWYDYGTLTHNQSIDVENIDVEYLMTTIYPVVIFRERFWRFRAKWGALDIDISEFRVYDENDVEMFGTWYHDEGISVTNGPASDTAPHIDNRSTSGSYYSLTSDDYLTIDLGFPKAIHKIIFWNKGTADYTNTVDQAGIDVYVALCLNGWSVEDASYYNHSATNNGVVVSPTTSGVSSEALHFDGSATITFPAHNQWIFNFPSWPNYAYETRFNLDRLPSDGEEFVFVENGIDGNRWRFCVRGDSGDVRISFFRNNAIWPNTAGNYLWAAADTGVWHHVSFVTTSASVYNIYLDGVEVTWASIGGANWGASESVTVGRNMCGYLEELRVSHIRRSTTPPTQPYERFTLISMYSSPDNIHYSKFAEDIDLSVSPNVFNEEYYTYFAVDLGRRHALEIIRSYGATDAHDFSPIANLDMSVDDISDINLVDFNISTDITDVRWVRIKMANGDGISRIIRKLGIYPDIQTNMTADGINYNTEWDDLGTGITTYTTEESVAFNATITASSEFYKLPAEALVNGNIEGGFSDVWGSDDESTQWVKIDLGSSKDIYKVIIYHGIDDSSTDYMVHDYTVETSTDDETYTTQFTITSNASYERAHQLVDSVAARYVKINITNYSSIATYRPSSLGGYGWFQGAVIKEIEVYEDYGHSKISSEDYPVICVNMNYQFYINGMTLVGMDPNDTSADWDSGLYAFSDSLINDPERVPFEEWGGEYSFERWIAIKQNTATEYNNGPDYLKHVQATSSQELKPADYSQWWHSDVSTLSEEYMYVKRFSSRSMKIEYPASSGVENIYFYEGDDFGTDELAAWRDGFSFWWHIDNIDNLDLEYGYFKFGGYDSSAKASKVEYRWNFSTISGSLSSGWNGLFLRFMNADSTIYTEPPELLPKDVRIPSTVLLKTIGYTFRGKGNSITMYWNGFGIVRNTFQDLITFDNGLYLTQNDFLTCPINELDLSHGTIEFNIRTDYNYKGVGYYYETLLRSLFHITNSANDVLGAMFSDNGLQIYYGNVDGELFYFGISEIQYIDIDSMFNMAFVFSNTGEHIDNDGSTIRVYIDNVLIAKTAETWDISDNKYFKFIFGGKALLALKEESFTAETHSVDGVVGNLKVYNYCKTDFSDVLNTEEVDVVKLKKPSELIEISKDNLTFYRVGSGNLPLSFSMVAPGTVVPVYVRPILTRGLTGAEKRTASLIVEWDVTV